MNGLASGSCSNNPGSSDIVSCISRNAKPYTAALIATKALRFISGLALCVSLKCSAEKSVTGNGFFATKVIGVLAIEFCALIGKAETSATNKRGISRYFACLRWRDMILLKPLHVVVPRPAKHVRLA